MCVCLFIYLFVAVCFVGFLLLLLLLLLFCSISAVFSNVGDGWVGVLIRLNVVVMVNKQ